jgi:ABC-type oligopeptide transport system substrate-binding subunit
MRKPIVFVVVAAATLVAGSLATAACAPAPRASSQISEDTVAHSQDATTPPTVQPLDCRGTTGWHGCGPGWFWRDGWHGPGCYPC